MTLYKIASVVLGLYLTFNVAYSQQSIDSIADDLIKHFSTKPSDVIYLQPSKGIYETGEDLWFKAYQFDARTFGVSAEGKTLYLQMIAPNDSVVWQEKYIIENGIVAGHIYVDDKLTEGDYLLEGYTKNSFHKNDSGEIIASRKIRIMKSISSAVPRESAIDTTFRFEMFPEGGNLVSGIPSKLAFKATNGSGIPVDVEGAVYQDDIQIREFKCRHDGMGDLLILPIENKSYKVVLTNGKSYPLPEVHSQGIVMRLVKQDKNQLDFIVSQSSSLPSQEVYLVGQMRGVVGCVAKGILTDNIKISIPVNNFTYQGIAEFTLYNANMQPMAERLVYVHNQKRLHIVAKTEKEAFATREKATIKIKVTDETGTPIRANLGVSVYDKAYNNPDDPTNMLTYCYLSSQIRGKIYNPGYYFDEKNSGRIASLDLLMLTQGWRRYIWRSSDPVYSGQTLLTDEINGVQTINNRKKNSQNQNTEQLIQVSGPNGNNQFVWADSLGRFTVGADLMKELRGGYVYLKSMLSKDFKPTLELVDYFHVIDSIRRCRNHYYPLIDLSKMVVSRTPGVKTDSTILLEAAMITAKGRGVFRDKFLGRLDSLAQAKFGPWVCSHGWLENYKSGYTHHHNPNDCPCVVDDGEPRTAPVIGRTYTIMKAEYFQCDVPGGWSFKPIDRQKVVYQGVPYSEDELLRMNGLWRTKGYYAAREFYQPDDIDMQSSMPDARNTLLWSPSVVTDEKGEATISFYCSDVNTGFIGLIEGVDGAGLLGTAKCEFRVIRKIK